MMKVDLSYLKNMSGNNKDLILEMIGIFIDQVNEFNRDMDLLYENKEYEKLGKLAHKAKSSISIMGLSGLSDDLKTLETLAKSGEKPEMYKPLINKFRKETNEAVEELNQVTNNLELYF